ncbi:putative membrane-anchored protein [Methanosarcina siciliae C2J]|uniref:Putative membrane-anchored protein n=1 Tax=Methanosarcina siciliae C2J TaxID=1434118 RepID=A0A0E3PPZ1_9EURY|nr:GDYXXLXY domain-containing protein [Methanosarcina siciliae]AKB36653.1 putative membrane-anchored protein [Methanosarcina siciliae C2J]
MKQKQIFYLTIVFWLLIFSGFILFKEYTLKTGKEILLKTEPVDPRDLFRGDYVILNYEISTLDLEKIPAEDRHFEYNDRVYLALAVEDGYGVPKKIYSTPPDNELYIKGTVKQLIYDWEEDGDGLIAEEPRIKGLRVEYGIESYFVPEGRGIEIERQQWGGEEGVDVKVVVDKYGNAVAESLLIDGQELEI